MESVLNVSVSCFPNYNTATNPVDINLLNWLQSDKYRSQVEQIRNEGDKTIRDRLKSKLPAITPSGTFTHRKEDALIQHNGFIQFDIDFKENQHLGNFYQLKDQICNIQNVAYCGQSVSGAGFWGLIPIAYPEMHKQHFDSLKKVFAHFGIIIDEKPKNVSSLRGYSYDPEPYFNHQALTFQRFTKPQPTSIKQYENYHIGTPDQAKVETCINEIQRRALDLTGSYDAWFEIGCSIASAFGESGRQYFHQVSQFHPEYSISKTDRQYSECLKGGYSFTIGTFLNYCDQSGIRYKGNIREEEIYSIKKGSDLPSADSPPSELPGEVGAFKSDKNIGGPLKLEFYHYSFNDLVQALGYKEALMRVEQYQRLSQQYSHSNNFIVHKSTLLTTYQNRHLQVA